jgi:hypothetical protein
MLEASEMRKERAALELRTILRLSWRMPLMPTLGLILKGQPAPKLHPMLTLLLKLRLAPRPWSARRLLRMRNLPKTLLQ